MSNPTVPYDLAAERATIGAVLIDPSQADILVEILSSADCFYLERHAAIWRAVVHCLTQRRPPDLLAVAARLRETASDQPIGLSELDACMAEAADPGRAIHYAHIVADAHARRRIIDAAGRVALIGYDTRRSVAEAHDAAAAEVLALSDTHTSGGYVSLSVAARRRADAYMQAMSGENIAGIPTPWADMNRIIGGLKSEDMIVIGGRPSMGKSAISGDLVAHCSGHQGLHVGVVSLEMSTTQWVDRLVSKISGVPLDVITNGRCTETQATAIFKAIGDIERWPMSVDDAPGQSITTIRSRARRLHARQPLDLLIIDYLQLCSPGDAENENAALTTISRGIKALARELKIPVIALAQLSRDLERRADKRPMLSDLRGSGSIEQDADHVWFIYRDEKYNPDSDARGTAEIIIAKQRNGPTGMARLAFSDESASFRNLDRYRSLEDYRHAAD